MTSQDTLPEPYNTRVRDAYAIIAGIPADRMYLARFLTSRSYSPENDEHPFDKLEDAENRGIRRGGRDALKVNALVAHDCGTVGCIAGWLSLHPDFQVGRMGEFTGELKRFVFGDFHPRTGSVFAYRGGCRFDKAFNGRKANDKQVALNRLLRVLGWNAQDARERAMQDGAE